MCLNSAVRINTEKDIVCYKLFWQYGNTLYSFYRNSPYKLNVTRSTRTKTPKLYCSNFNGEKTYCIQESAFHSFANYGDVKEFHKGSSSVIVKCIIPKNSEYIYEGTYAGVKSYASQKLKPIEIIEQSISKD